jgi:hypothetical protein
MLKLVAGVAVVSSARRRTKHKKRAAPWLAVGDGPP